MNEAAISHTFKVAGTTWLPGRLRKFSDSVQGAKASANLYSIIQCAKLNGLEPYAYLRHVFTQLPKAQTVEDIEALLPYQIDQADINPRS